MGPRRRVHAGLIGVVDAARVPAIASPAPASVPAWARSAAAVATVAPVLALVGLSVLLRITVLDAGYWTDESIAVGIAAKPLGAIPGTLRLDGSPPLYYLLLHGWMGVAGTGEAATRSLSLLLAATAVPVGWFAARDLFGARAGWLAAVCLAALPFLTRYAQETRMYALVVVLSLLVALTFVRAARTGRRRDVLALAASATALLYTHNWGLFLVAAAGLGWIVLWRRGRAGGRAGLAAAALVAVAYAPWVPSLASQVQHTAAPWAPTPSVWQLLLVPVALAGIPGTIALAGAIGVATAGRTRPPEAAVWLLALAATTAGLAWLANQGEPAWADRYLAVLVGPALLGAAGVLAGGGRATVALVLAAVLAWALWSPPPVKSNARALAATVAPQLVPGDVVLAAGPQHVPLLAHYLPPGLRYLTPAGRVGDPAVTDWRDLVGRLERADPARLADRAVRGLPAGGHLVLVTPLAPGAPSAPLPAIVHRRALELNSRLRTDPRLEVRTDAGSLDDGVRTRLYATVFERRRR